MKRMFTDFCKKGVAAVAGLLLMGGVAQAQVSYTFDEKKTVTLKYLGDNESEAGSGTVVEFDEIFGQYNWFPENCSGVKKVVFDESFTEGDYHLTSISSLFNGCEDLETVEGLGNLNTSELEDVTNMFDGCSSLKSVDFTDFNTSSVMMMRCMFNCCDALEELDLSSFNTSNVREVDQMFRNCDKLKKIYVSDDFDVSSVHFSNLMFYRCYELVGAVAYKEKMIDDASMANYETGYFTYKEAEGSAPFVSYTVDDDNTMTLTYLGDSKESDDTVVRLEKIFGTEGWVGNTCPEVKKVVFDESFNTDGYSIEDMCQLFENCANLETVEGLGNLNTAKLKSATNLFYNCSNLKYVDFTGFDISNATLLFGMFQKCSNIEELDLSGFNTSNSTDLYGMFAGCSKLKTIYVSDSFVVDKVTNSSVMFNGCESLVGAVAYKEKRIDDATMANYTTGYFTNKNAEPSNPTAVKILDSENLSGATEYYDLQGRKMAAPSRGSMVIVRKGGRSQLTVNN